MKQSILKSLVFLSAVILFGLVSCVKTPAEENLPSDENEGKGRLIEVGVDDMVDTKSILEGSLQTKAHNWLVLPVPAGEPLSGYDIKDVFGNVLISYPLVSESAPKLLLYENVNYDVYVLANIPSSIQVLTQGMKTMFSGKSVSPDDFQLFYSYGGKEGIEAVKSFGYMPRAIVDKNFKPSAGKNVKSPVSLLHELRLKVTPQSFESLKVYSAAVCKTPCSVYPFSSASKKYSSYLDTFNDLSSADLQKLNAGQEVTIWIPENLAGSYSQITSLTDRQPDVLKHYYIDNEGFSFIDLDLEVSTASYSGNLEVRHYLGVPGDFSSFNIVRNVSTGLNFKLNPSKIPAKNGPSWNDDQWIFEYYAYQEKEGPSDFKIVSNGLDRHELIGQKRSFVFSEDVVGVSYKNNDLNESLDNYDISGESVTLDLVRIGSHTVEFTSESGKKISLDFDVDYPLLGVKGFDNNHFSLSELSEGSITMSARGRNILLPSCGLGVNLAYYHENVELSASDFDQNLLNSSMTLRSNLSASVPEQYVYLNSVPGSMCMYVKYLDNNYLKYNNTYSVVIAPACIYEKLMNDAAYSKYRSAFTFNVRPASPFVNFGLSVENGYYFKKACVSEVSSKNYGAYIDFSNTDVFNVSKGMNGNLLDNLTFNFVTASKLFKGTKDVVQTSRNFRSGSNVTRTSTLTVWLAKGISLFINKHTDTMIGYPVFIDYNNSVGKVDVRHEDSDAGGIFTWDPINIDDVFDVGFATIDKNKSPKYRNALLATAMKRDYKVRCLFGTIDYPNPIEYNGRELDLSTNAQENVLMSFPSCEFDKYLLVSDGVKTISKWSDMQTSFPQWVSLVTKTGLFATATFTDAGFPVSTSPSFYNLTVGAGRKYCTKNDCSLLPDSYTRYYNYIYYPLP